MQTDGPYGGYIFCFAESPNGAGGTNLFAATGGGVFLSTNNGTSWTEVDTGLGGALALAVSGTNLFAGNDNGVFLSTNNGSSWTPVNTGMTNPWVSDLAVSGTNLFANHVYNTGVFLSTNNGTTWTEVGLTNENVSALTISGTNLFAGTLNNGLFRSTDNGTNWTAVNTGLPSNTNVSTFANSPDGTGGTNLFAGTYGSGVFLSTNNGTSWNAVNSGLPANDDVHAFAFSGTNLFAGTYGGGVFLSTNNGTSWTAVNIGLTNTLVEALAVSGSDLFAGTDGGVWRRPLSEMITSVRETNVEVPRELELEQNYPNPFNPSTKIKYTIPNVGAGLALSVLKVYDVLGNEIATLVNEEKPAGSYEIEFNAVNLPSGVYLYRLQAGNFIETKKLMLLK